MSMDFEDTMKAKTRKMLRVVVLLIALASVLAGMFLAVATKEMLIGFALILAGAVGSAMGKKLE